jgi:hypothetical protein
MARRPQATDVLHCTECQATFKREDGVKWVRKGDEPIMFCRSNCLLDWRERAMGRSPRLRWPLIKGLLWRGKDVSL